MLDQKSGTEIEMRPAFAQQLGNVADVHCRSHSGSPDERGEEVGALRKTFYSALKMRSLPRNAITLNHLV
jgi:hypothetical protein